MKTYLIPAALLLMLLAACSQNEAKENANQPNQTSLRQTETAQNNTGGTRPQNIKSLNQIQLTKTVRNIVEKDGDLFLDSVMLNGANMWVIAHTNKPLAPREIIIENAALYNRLKDEFPQFHIEVKVEESRQQPIMQF